jgi:hypothetical protein
VREKLMNNGRMYYPSGKNDAFGSQPGTNQPKGDQWKVDELRRGFSLGLSKHDAEKRAGIDAKPSQLIALNDGTKVLFVVYNLSHSGRLAVMYGNQDPNLGPVQHEVMIINGFTSNHKERQISYDYDIRWWETKVVRPNY